MLKNVTMKKNLKSAKFTGLWISKFNCKYLNGYNLTDGGEGSSGFVHSAETLWNIVNKVDTNLRKKIIACKRSFLLKQRRFQIRKIRISFSIS